MISNLPSSDGKGSSVQHSHPGLSDRTCADKRAPYKVKIHSLIDVPQTVDTLIRNIPCTITKLDDQLDFVTSDIIKAFYEGVSKLEDQKVDPFLEKNYVNSGDGAIAFFKAIANKYIATL